MNQNLIDAYGAELARRASFTHSWERRSPRKEKTPLKSIYSFLVRHWKGLVVLFLGALYLDKFYLSYEVLTKGF